MKGWAIATSGTKRGARRIVKADTKYRHRILRLRGGQGYGVLRTGRR